MGPKQALRLHWLRRRREALPSVEPALQRLARDFEPPAAKRKAPPARRKASWPW